MFFWKSVMVAERAAAMVALAALSAMVDSHAEHASVEPRYLLNMVCYNELTVLGDLDVDGKFSPAEWHEMFRRLDSKHKDWRISSEEFRLGCPNCDFVVFMHGGKKGKKPENTEIDGTTPRISVYQWQDIMQNADDNGDFLLDQEEMEAAGLEPFGKQS
mmetsp:Transcript_14114/g.27368  ORF Transcript_14114/g.27368 Transcript_14114/m.27368 type:complete len:159 (-) Transcript_14114:40-516(-)